LTVRLQAPGGEAVWVDVECGEYRADLRLWRRMLTSSLSDAPREILDVGCGTGRVSLALAGPGCRLTAIDVEPELVRVVQSRAAQRGVPVEAQVADARHFQLERRFDLVLAPMQLTQLLASAEERVAMLSRMREHLKEEGLVGLALLDPDEEWEAEEADGPVPDMLERDGWVYSSHPLAVRRADGGSVLELDRVRRAVSPAGELSESFSRVSLTMIGPEQLEQEARTVGLQPQRRRRIPPTGLHVGSTVVVLRCRG